MWIIVGLGNPGEPYRLTRHNAGFWVVEAFARQEGIPWRKPYRRQAEIGRGRVAGEDVLLVKPLTFMNRSGEAVAPIWKSFSRGDERMIVVHDDLDLPFGRMKIRMGGGSGGHKGVASIQEALDWDGFLRLKIGIGRPAQGQTPEAYVLSRFRPEEMEGMPLLIAAAAEALETVVREGPERAMNRYNIQRQWDRREEPQEEGDRKTRESRTGRGRTVAGGKEEADG